MREREARRFNQREYKRSETDRGENRAPNIEPFLRVAPALGHVANGQRDYDERQRKIDEENSAPGDVIDQPAAEHGADRRGDGAEAGPGANRPAALFF